MIRHPSRTPAIVATVLLLVGLAGCDTGQGVDAGPNPTSTPTSELTREPTESATDDARDESSDHETTAQVPIVLPACNAVTFERFEGASDDFKTEEIAVDTVGAEVMGPSARAAAENALQAKGCSVYLPNSGFMVSLLLAELDDETRTNLMADLDESIFEHTVIDESIDFYFNEEVHDEDGMGWFRSAAYVFSGDAWVAEFGGGMGGGTGDEGPERVRTPSQFSLGYLDAMQPAQ